MHKIYSHKGIVLSSKGIGEKNSFVLILSEGLGLLRAKAISLRVAKGKLKGHLVPYTLGEYSFVRGKDGWRLIQAEATKNFFSENSDLNKKKIVARVCQLISKMVPEVPDNKLFLCIYSGFETLPNIDASILKTFEITIVSRILNILGYLSLDEYPKEFMEVNDFSDQTLLHIKHKEKELIKLINQGLRASQLVNSV